MHRQELHYRQLVMRLLLAKIRGDLDACAVVADEIGESARGWRNVTKILLRVALAGWDRDDGETDALIEVLLGVISDTLDQLAEPA